MALPALYAGRMPSGLCRAKAPISDEVRRSPPLPDPCSPRSPEGSRMSPDSPLSPKRYRLLGSMCCQSAHLVRAWCSPHWGPRGHDDSSGWTCAHMAAQGQAQVCGEKPEVEASQGRIHASASRPKPYQFHRKLTASRRKAGLFSPCPSPVSPSLSLESFMHLRLRGSQLAAFLHVKSRTQA